MLPDKAKVTTDFELNVYYDSSNRIQYICEAESGNTDSSVAHWRIKKIFYSGTSSRVTSERWADGSNEFRFVIDDRADYTYADSV